jgi:hypothetical protein
MKSKFLKTAFVGTILSASCFVNVANAVFIDNDSYTTDTESGLDWLDWTATVNVSESNALTANASYRLATDLELRNLLDRAFNCVGIHHCNGTTQFSNFTDMFGQTKQGGTGVTLSNYGQYAIGSNLHMGYKNGIVELGNASTIFGVGLVKNTVVPEPSTLAIFGLGLLGLASRRFKKQA